MGELRPSADAAAWPRRLRHLFWITVTLVGLLNPALSLPAAEPVWPAAAGLAGFALLYVALMWSCLSWPWPPGEVDRLGLLRLTGLSLFAALGIVLALAYGGEEGQGWMLVMLYVAVAGTAILPQPRASTTWLVAAAATQLVIGAGHITAGGGTDTAEGTELTLVVVNTLLVGGLIHVWRRRDELITHLRHTRAELAGAAVTNERLRISRDLHDLLGHTLSLIVVKAEVAKRSAGQDPPAAAVAAREAGEIEQIGRRALGEVREAVTGYRRRPFAAELDAARTALADAGVEVTVRTTGTPLPAPVDGLFGWVVREATTNVVRHSGARHCHIEVRLADGRATLEVRDDGVGKPMPAERGPTGRELTGGGLTGLAERLAAAGGRLEAGGSAPGGWRVQASVPTDGVGSATTAGPP